MHATSDTDEKARVGDALTKLELTASACQPVAIPDPAGDFVHLQFRRFAGCPICNLHLRSIVRRYDEIRSHGIREVVVFHSTVAELAKYEAELPFPLVADPERQLYRRFSVERRLSSLLRGRVLVPRSRVRSPRLRDAARCARSDRSRPPEVSSGCRPIS